MIWTDCLFVMVVVVSVAIILTDRSLGLYVLEYGKVERIQLQVNEIKNWLFGELNIIRAKAKVMSKLIVPQQFLLSYIIWVFYTHTVRIWIQIETTKWISLHFCHVSVMGCQLLSSDCLVFICGTGKPLEWFLFPFNCHSSKEKYTPVRTHNMTLSDTPSTHTWYSLRILYSF